MTIRLTAAQVDALVRCFYFCDAGEWPFEDRMHAVAKRAVDKLEDLLIAREVAIKLKDDPR